MAKPAMERVVAGGLGTADNPHPMAAGWIYTGWAAPAAARPYSLGPETTMPTPEGGHW